LDLATGQRTILVRGGSQAEYVEPGYLVYAVAGALRAVRFDPATRTIGSDPVPVVEQVRTLPTGAAEFSVSGQGTLVYVPGGATGATRSLVWVTRQGQETAITAPPRAYVVPRLSPDGRRVALDIRDQDHDIWIGDLARQTLTRLTDSPAPDLYPVWTPDGQRIVFASARAGKLNLFWQAADNTGPVERLTTSPNPQLPTAIAPDGTRLIVEESVPASGRDLRVLRMQGRPETVTLAPPPSPGGPRQTEPLMQAKFNGANGEVSPDGHWLAYQSNDSGRNQVFVRPFPNVDDGHWTISTNGGTRPVWARSGRELFYLDGTNALTAVSVHTTPIFSVDTPTKLFEGRYYANEDGRTYDVSPDGQRFLMIKAIASGDQAPTLPSMVVVLNWLEELKARVPPK
jgi:serine/threonine-protein kinase